MVFGAPKTQEEVPLWNLLCNSEKMFENNLNSSEHIIGKLQTRYKLIWMFITEWLWKMFQGDFLETKTRTFKYMWEGDSGLYKN